MANRVSIAKDCRGIHGDIVALLDAARRSAARSINALMTATYWQIGRSIVEFEQGVRDRAAYGEALIERLSKDLTRRFGRGFSRQSLWQMRVFHLARPAVRTGRMSVEKPFLDAEGGFAESPFRLGQLQNKWGMQNYSVSVGSTARRMLNFKSSG